MSAESTVSSAGPHTPQSKRAISSIHSTKGVPGITTVLEAFHCDMCHDPGRVDPHNVEGVDPGAVPLSAPTNSHNAQKETVDNGGVHRVTTATSITVLISYFSP